MFAAAHQQKEHPPPIAVHQWLVWPAARMQAPALPCERGLPGAFWPSPWWLTWLWVPAVSGGNSQPVSHCGLECLAFTKVGEGTHLGCFCCVHAACLCMRSNQCTTLSRPRRVCVVCLPLLCFHSRSPHRGLGGGEELSRVDQIGRAHVVHCHGAAMREGGDKARRVGARASGEPDVRMRSCHFCMFSSVTSPESCMYSTSLCKLTACTAPRAGENTVPHPRMRPPCRHIPHSACWRRCG